MNEEMRENIKIGLLGLIALTLIANTFMGNGSSSNNDLESSSSASNSLPSENTGAITPDLSTPPPLDQAAQNTEVEEEKPAGPVTSIQFAEESHDFGNIKQDSENKYLFKFTNTGSNPLIIESAKGSCGCTVPQYPKEPVLPGKTGEIEVEYKPGKQKGSQTKTVTITANTEPAVSRISIKANVEEI